MWICIQDHLIKEKIPSILVELVHKYSKGLLNETDMGMNGDRNIH